MIGFKNSFDRIYTSIYEGLRGPEVIEWFPSYLCNSKCQYCGGYDEETKAAFRQLVPYEEIKRIIKLSAECGVTLWNIGGRGGEPFFYPDVINSLQEVKQYNVKGILITNGLLLDKEGINKLVNIKWDILRISLDSHSAEIHDRLRGIQGNFNRIDKALSLFKNIKKDQNTRFPGLTCCPVITNNNYKFIKEYMDYCIEKGVDEIQFMPLINVHERAEKLVLSDYQKKELVALLEEKASENRIRHNISFVISLYKNNDEENKGEWNIERSFNKKLYCVHLWKTLVISEDGYLSPCSLIKDKLVKIKSSLTDAWGSEVMSELRSKILNAELISSACKDCCGPLRQETINFNRYLLEKAQQ